MASDGTRGEIIDARAMLDAWREAGADRVAPVRFQFMDALQRRAAAHGGEARRLLDAKLAALIQAYETELEGAPVDAAEYAPAPASAIPEPGPLAALTAYIADPGTDARGAADLRATYPELQTLEYFRGVWSRVSADRQVRQSQEQVHKNAGPLNSNQLVHRALSLMREVSPGYLQQFLSYIDALMWMEQVHAAIAPPPKEAAPRAGAKKTARGKGR
ncbi:DUF2894 domain-containing protein [Achromobacter aegrifaciens]|uniref:Protein of uncharacterized function (DUF2894) n=1 Tax=Achromobacter aegrifaciens TaxID=1287736 RepID=A0AAD2J264_ACHAE|nr:DUF2894 domain-containing protein [Achromobacter aegrifaciens]CUJ45130.1 Protein of uncharacterised function (DUF2894) [Achromobacter aegrifaciens]